MFLELAEDVCQQLLLGMVGEGIRSGLRLLLRQAFDEAHARGDASELSRSTIYRRIARGTFPAQIRLGLRASAWSSEALRAWIDDPEGYRVTRNQK